MATLEDEAYQKYNDALDATTLTFTNDAGTLIPANFDNLCGLSSINNGLNKNFIFRVGEDDSVILPDDVYDGYEKYGGSDPYEFALFMMGADKDAVSEAENTYITELDDSTISDNLKALRNSKEEAAKKLATSYAEKYYDANSGKSKDDFIKDTEQSILDGNDNITRDDEEIEALKKAYNDANKNYRFKLYKTSGGCEKIYKLAKGEEGTFDSAKFNYYLRYGMLIRDKQGTLDGCVKASDYAEGFGTNSELLNQMLQSGRILVDTIEFDNLGSVKDSTTSVAADSNLQFTPTSTIDKKALAKAEAEYEHTMKEIDRKDKRYDMDLNKLETERTALTTEYDSVKKVIQENVERTFGIFS